MKYKYTLEADVYFKIKELEGIIFKCKFGCIENGSLTIKKGYSWNGATGVINTARTYWASCIHDFLYQYRVVTQKTADIIFYNQLKNDNFEFSRLYFWGVRFFGKYFY